MASPEVLDFKKLLAPLSAADGAGMDLRADASPISDLFAIKGARKSARDAERQHIPGDEEAPGGSPDWRPVLDKGLRVIAEKSKDLEVTAYLIEALLRQHGFAGLRDGFRLARELVERYWDGLYPRPDEDGLETRLAPLAGLNGEGAEGTLMVPIAKVPITEQSSFGRLCFTHYQEGQSLSRISDAKVREKRMNEAGAISLEKLQKAVGETSAEFYKNLVEDLTQSRQEYEKLCSVLEARCNGAAPPSSNIRLALESCLDIVKDLARAKLPAGGSPPTEAVPESQVAPSTNGAAREASGVIQTREDALNALTKVADFFRRTEPHSVISYTLEQVVSWGRMSLPELLAELIPEEGPRKNLFKQVGIRPLEPAPKEGGKK